MNEPAKWEVRSREGVWTGKVWMKASCIHRDLHRGACPGCYARLWRAFSEIENGAKPRPIIKQMGVQMRAEGAAAREKRR